MTPILRNIWIKYGTPERERESERDRKKERERGERENSFCKNQLSRKVSIFKLCKTFIWW